MPPIECRLDVEQARNSEHVVRHAGVGDLAVGTGERPDKAVEVEVDGLGLMQCLVEAQQWHYGDPVDMSST